jgi:hypothetical protein
MKVIINSNVHLIGAIIFMWIPFQVYFLSERVSFSFSDHWVFTEKCLTNLRHQKVCESAFVLIDYGSRV